MSSSKLELPTSTYAQAINFCNLKSNFYHLWRFNKSQRMSEDIDYFYLDFGEFMLSYFYLNVQIVKGF